VMIHQAGSTRIDAKLELGRPALLDDVGRTFRSLRVIIAHCGLPWVDEALFLLTKHPNCYAELSSLIASVSRRDPSPNPPRRGPTLLTDHLLDVLAVGRLSFEEERDDLFERVPVGLEQLVRACVSLLEQPGDLLVDHPLRVLRILPSRERLGSKVLGAVLGEPDRPEAGLIPNSRTILVASCVAPARSFAAPEEISPITRRSAARPPRRTASESR